MSRSMQIVALLSSLLLVLNLAAAVANIAMDPDPPIDVDCTALGAPDVILLMEASDQIDLDYTVSDVDMFTPGPPPPPPGPYEGPREHRDNVIIASYTNVNPGTWFWATVTPFPGEWAEEASYTAHLSSFNETGEPQTSYFGIFWDDRADGPMGIPPGQVAGNANDASCGFQKQVSIAP